MEQDTTLISYGGEIKTVEQTEDGWKFGGWLVVFDSHDASRLRDKFTKSTDFDIEDGERRGLYYNHGLDGTIKRTRLGDVRVFVKDAGVWIEGQIKKRNDYLKGHAEHIAAKIKEFGLSSGAPAHLVERKAIDGGHEITMWPLAEASITPTPAEPLTGCFSIKALEELAELDEEFKKFNPRQPRDDLGMWTAGSGNKFGISSGHAVAVMKHEGITDPKLHDEVRQAVESGKHKTREAVLAHIDEIHQRNGTTPPKSEDGSKKPSSERAEDAKTDSKSPGKDDKKPNTKLPKDKADKVKKIAQAENDVAGLEKRAGSATGPRKASLLDKLKQAKAQLKQMKQDFKAGYARGQALVDKAAKSAEGDELEELTDEEEVTLEALMDVEDQEAKSLLPEDRAAGYALYRYAKEAGKTLEITNEELPAGSSFEDHSKLVLAAVGDMQERVESLAEMRCVKSNRKWSDAKYEALNELADGLKSAGETIKGLAEEHAPRAQEPVVDAGDVMQALAKFQVIRARAATINL